MHDRLRDAAGLPWNMWMEGAAVALAIMVAPFVAAIWPEK